jgi:hypothetical protein
MKILILLIFLLFFAGCSENELRFPSTNRKILCKKTEIDNYEISKFYKDYDIFSRKGITEVLGDSFYIPFFAISNLNDTTTLLRLFDTISVTKMEIPKGNQTIASFHNITDGPRYIYAKIQGAEIIRYGYATDPFVSEKDIIPEIIEVISRDTLLTFFRSCLKTSARKVMPFSEAVDRKCLDCLVHCFSKDNDTYAFHYYGNLDSTESLSKQKPGKGLYLFQRRFKYWRDYHNLQQMR